MGHRRARGLGIGLASALAAAAAGCGAARETPQATARQGDLLVRADETRVHLAAPFRPAVPNSLQDGVVRIETAAGSRLMEVNAVCSMPGLPDWPPYDNLYGRGISQVDDAKGLSGRTEWQVLYPFQGEPQVRMGVAPGAWVARLRDNLCRRGDFDDR
jgi:hypothetical protein